MLWKRGTTCIYFKHNPVNHTKAVRNSEKCDSSVIQSHLSAPCVSVQNGLCPGLYSTCFVDCGFRLICCLLVCPLLVKPLLWIVQMAYGLCLKWQTAESARLGAAALLGKHT